MSVLRYFLDFASAGDRIMTPVCEDAAKDHPSFLILMQEMRTLIIFWVDKAAISNLESRDVHSEPSKECPIINSETVQMTVWAGASFGRTVEVHAAHRG